MSTRNYPNLFCKDLFSTQFRRNQLIWYDAVFLLYLFLSWLTTCRPWSCCSCVRSSELLSCSRCRDFCKLCLCSFSTRSSFSKPSLCQKETLSLHISFYLNTQVCFTLVCPGLSAVSAKHPLFLPVPLSCLYLTGHSACVHAQSSAV